MSHLELDASTVQTVQDLNSPASLEIRKLLTQIKHSHDLRYKLINLEAWALAQTMDNFLPGFWSRFLENRRTALKQFLNQKRTDKYRVIL
jgi:hypothetical protein